ncbi:MAG: Fe(2+)-trafficking protein [Phycisphaerales bacterium]
MDIDERIRRFEELVRDDPENDMALFSLGGAYNQAGRYREAADAYLRCVAANPTMSKAYQLAGAALMASDQKPRAAETLAEGYRVAAGQGDLMPKKAMADLLHQLGEPLPEVEEKGTTPAPPGSFIDQKTGRPGAKLARAPFRNALGEWIQANISKQTWDEWIGLGTKIINELRLDLSRDEHDAVYDYAMRRYLGLRDEQVGEMLGRVPPAPEAQYKEVIDEILRRGGHLEEFQGEMHKGVG